MMTRKNRHPLGPAFQFMDDKSRHNQRYMAAVRHRRMLGLYIMAACVIIAAILLGGIALW